MGFAVLNLDLNETLCEISVHAKNYKLQSLVFYKKKKKMWV
jgi:hypothetical protein